MAPVTIAVERFSTWQTVPTSHRARGARFPTSRSELASGRDLAGDAFARTLALALWLTPRWNGRAYIGGVLCYILLVVIFALAQSPMLAGAALLLTGIRGTGFGTMQAALIYLASPPECARAYLASLPSASASVRSAPFG